MKKLTLLFAALFIAAMSFAQTTWYLCGSMNGWSVGNSTYKLVDNELTINLAAGEYEFKLNNGSWAQELNYSHVDHDCSTAELKGSGTSNITLTIAEQQDVTFSVTAATKVCVKAVSGEIENVYVVAGDAALMGVEWNGTASQNQMTVVDGVGTLVKENVSLAAGSYGFKIVRNGSAWIPDGSDNNNILTIAETAVYNVTFTHVIGTQTASAVAAKVDGGEVVVTYYIKHPWGTGADADWAWKTMERQESGLYTYEGLWGGIGANIGTAMDDATATWFQAADINGASVATVGDNVRFEFDATANTLSLVLLSEPKEKEYFIMGELVPWGWNDAGTEAQTPMTKNEMGVYEYIIESFSAEAKTYQYKLREGYDWDGYQLPANGNAEYTFTATGDYKLVFTANLLNNTLELDAEKVGGEPTGLESIQTLDTNAPMFNVLGQEVNTQYKGVVIQNGQKFIVK